MGNLSFEFRLAMEEWTALPGGISQAELRDAVLKHLANESWDTVTIKTVMLHLEKLFRTLPGSFKTVKPLVKMCIDDAMQLLSNASDKTEPRDQEQNKYDDGVGNNDNHTGEQRPLASLPSAKRQRVADSQTTTPEALSETQPLGSRVPDSQAPGSDLEVTTLSGTPEAKVPLATVLSAPEAPATSPSPEGSARSKEVATLPDPEATTLSETRSQGALISPPKATAEATSTTNTPPAPEATATSEATAPEATTPEATTTAIHADVPPPSSQDFASGGTGDGAAAADDDDDDDESGGSDSETLGADAPRLVGSPTHKADGKIFHSKFVKDGVEYSIGQDVYLENNEEIPFVCRLQSIFCYAFAPTEVYFEGRWYYRESDVHEYARLEGATDKVTFEGGALTCGAQELFFSLHLDENHADCVLFGCKVLLRLDSAPDADELSGAHEYYAYRAYDKKHVYAHNDLPTKKLRDALDKEVRRSEKLYGKPEPKREVVVEPEIVDNSPLSNDELRALSMPRRFAEVWLGTKQFGTAMIGCLARCMQRINGKRSFFVGLVVGVKRVNRPYKVGKQTTDLALQLRTVTGVRLSGVDTLSNEAPTDEDLARFKVAIVPVEARRRLRTSANLMRDHSDLFAAEEMERAQREEERLRSLREAAARQEAEQKAERARREAERDDLRRRAAEKVQTQTESGNWWHAYVGKKVGDRGREIAKLRSRLKRFDDIIKRPTTTEVERANAERLARQCRDKLEWLEEQKQAEGH